MKNGFNKRRFERKPYLVDFRRLEPPRGGNFGKGKVLGRWSHQMSFKMSSSRKVEWECPPGGFVG
jgi:hypothetical protein